MKDIKISLISTLKNEELLIRKFLDSLLSQSRSPDEIIIVDGGSADRTVEIIKSYMENGSPIKLIIEKGVNIATGRNIAIKNARHELIAVTDAGCRIDKDWLKNLIRPFEENDETDVASGWYEADADNTFEETVAWMTYPKLKTILRNSDEFLPSSRSIAFKKSAWEKVGGYPEWLTFAGEDTLFDLNLKRAGYKFIFAPDALVYWKVRSSRKSFFRQYYLYAKGDKEAGAFTGYYVGLILKKYLPGASFIALGFKWYIFWILFLTGAIFYGVRIARRYPQHPFRAIEVVILKELAQICGWVAGKSLVERKK